MIHRTRLPIGYSSLLQALKLLPARFFWECKVSVAQAFAPCIGFFISPLSCFFVVICRTFIDAVFGTFSVDFHLPTFAGSLYLSSKNKTVVAIILLLCIGLFLLHPIGRSVPYYPVYWFIPLLIIYSHTSSIFLQSVGSTFTTHAVGTVIWIYSHQSTPLFWHTLFSQVWVERMVYACALTGAYYAFASIMKLLPLLNRRTA
jgi:hypothetical protein